MDETNNLVPRERPTPARANPLQTRSPFLALDLMPREPHLLDYLIVLRKHQWLIMFFLLAVVSIVTIATFRMQPIYEATARVEDRPREHQCDSFRDSEQDDDYRGSGGLHHYAIENPSERNPGDADGQVHGPRPSASNLAAARESRRKPRREGSDASLSGPRPWAHFLAA